MLPLLDFLSAAPKSYVIKIHRRESPGEGLLPAAKVIQLVQDWTLRPERVAQVLQEIEAPGRYLLALVYVSEDRGAAEGELLSAQEGQGLAPSQAALLLARLEQEMLLYARQGEGPRSYHGFRELAGPVLEAALPELLAPAPAPAGSGSPATTGSGSEAAAWISYRHFLVAHLAHFLGQVDLGAVKITQNGEMHRKDAQELAGRFAFAERLSTSIPAEEVQFLLRFAAHARLIEQEDGVLRLSGEGKAFGQGSRAAAEAALRAWWSGTRLRGMGRTLQVLAALPVEPVRVAALANLLWIQGGAQKKTYQDPKSSFTWENLPKALQELWLQGLIDFGMAKGRIAWFRPARGLADILAGEPRPEASRPVSLPNMESLVPIDGPFDRQSHLELVGLRSNDEHMARYRFTKESVIQGLQAGLPMEAFKALLAWLGYEGPAQRTLLDWASTYASTLFMDALLLRVSDPHRLRELQEIPQFMELVTETVPGFGFVIPRANKPRVRELLQHFGLVPGEDHRRETRHEPVVLEPGTWALVSADPGPAAYREAPAVVRTAPPQAAEKQAAAAREQDLATRLDAIEAAIEGEKKVEFSYHGPTPRRVTLKPLLLLRHRAPVKLIGIEVDTGHRNEYLMDQVKSLRVVE